MRRRLVTTLLAAVTLLVAGCQQGVTLLTDPNAILAAAASTTASATSVHIDLSADGPLEIDPFGTGAGAAMDLRGTTASADLDLAANKVRANFSSPALMGIAGELIVVDGSAYVKTTLTGAKYLKTTVSGTGGTSPAPSAPALGAITDLLTRADLKPVKGEDVPCAGGTCYTVTVNLTSEELAALAAGSATGGTIPSIPSIPAIPGIALPDLGDASVDLAILVEQTSTRLSGIDVELHLGATGDPHVIATFTKWNEPVTVGAPPADQVAAP